MSESVQAKVSVIIPVYNAQQYLAETLESVLAQTITPLEVICIDDGSADNSLEVLQGFASRHENIKILTQENTGSGAARNHGIKAANGKYIAFMDADDKYVFFVLYKTNCIAVYNKEGEYIRQIDLPVTAGEPENISHVGDTFYIVYNNPSWTGGIVYEVKITGKN